MRNIKSVLKKGILCFLSAVILVTAMPAVEAQAAGKISYSKAVIMYNNKMDYWARKNNRATITYDLRDRSGWNYNDRGKKISVRSFWYYGNLRYVFKDVNGDGIVEAFFHDTRSRAMIALTIYRNQVKLLGTFRVTDYHPNPLRYNRKNKTFAIYTRINARSISRNIFKITNGKLYRVCTLSDYVCPMEPNGKTPKWYWVNGRRKSVSSYRNYYRKYCRFTNTYGWGP